MDGPIASAVVLPEELSAPASPPTSLKRRQSSASEERAKKPRLDDNVEANNRRGSTNGTKPAAPVRREKGRERRLFGAVLGALSQNPTTTAQKRRSEIEKRQQAQRRLEDEESEQRKAERIARRKVQRWKEQKHFEKQSMRVRHENLLSMAHFLQTKAEPHLYYKPWETGSDEEERIRDQIAEARETIEREVEEYEARQDHEGQRDRHAPDEGEARRDAEDFHTGKSHDADAPRGPFSTINGGTNGSANSPKDLDMEDHDTEKPGGEAVRYTADTEDVMDSTVPRRESPADEPSKDNDDENGEDVVEEAAEDTVIY